MFPTAHAIGSLLRKQAPPSVRLLLGLLLKVGGSLLVLAVLLWLVDLRRVFAILLRTDLVLFAAGVLLWLAGQGLNALKWAWLAEALALPFRRGRYLRVYFMGLFLMTFLPGSLGGDVGRAVLLGGGGGKAGSGLWGGAYSVLADRYSGMMFLLVLSSLTATTVGAYASLSPWLWGFTAAVCLGWLCLGLVAARGGGSGSRLGRALAAISIWEQRLRTPAVLLRVGGTSTAIQAINSGVLVLLAMALHLSVPAAALVTAYGLITVATLAPVSINGLGIREGGYVLLLGMAGLGADEALGFGALWSAAFLLACLLSGVAWILPGAHPRKQSD